MPCPGRLVTRCVCCRAGTPAPRPWLLRCPGPCCRALPHCCVSNRISSAPDKARSPLARHRRHDLSSASQGCSTPRTPRSPSAAVTCTASSPRLPRRRWGSTPHAASLAAAEPTAPLTPPSADRATLPAAAGGSLDGQPPAAVKPLYDCVDVITQVGGAGGAQAGRQLKPSQRYRASRTAPPTPPHPIPDPPPAVAGRQPHARGVQAAVWRQPAGTGGPGGRPAGAGRRRRRRRARLCPVAPHPHLCRPRLHGPLQPLPLPMLPEVRRRPLLLPCWAAPARCSPDTWLDHPPPLCAAPAAVHACAAAAVCCPCCHARLHCRRCMLPLLPCTPALPLRPSENRLRSRSRPHSPICPFCRAAACPPVRPATTCRCGMPTRP